MESNTHKEIKFPPKTTINNHLNERERANREQIQISNRSVQDGDLRKSYIHRDLHGRDRGRRPTEFPQQMHSASNLFVTIYYFVDSQGPKQLTLIYHFTRAPHLVLPHAARVGGNETATRGRVLCVFTFYSSDIFDQLIAMTFTVLEPVRYLIHNLYYSGFLSTVG